MEVISLQFCPGHVFTKVAAHLNIIIIVRKLMDSVRPDKTIPRWGFGLAMNEFKTSRIYYWLRIEGKACRFMCLLMI